MVKIQPFQVDDGYSEFTDLTDVPLNYINQDNRALKVNSTGDGIEFDTIRLDGYISLPNQISSPPIENGLGAMYVQDVDGYSEFHFMDNYGNSTLITRRGYVNGAMSYVNVKNFGETGNPTGDNATINAAIARAEELIAETNTGATLYFPSGYYYYDHAVDGYLNFYGKKISIIGDGKSTVITAVNQNGPVLCMGGKSLARVSGICGGFTLRGDNVSIGPQNQGLRIFDGWATFTFKDIMITNCSGEALWTRDVICSSFETITLGRGDIPVAPYMKWTGWTNGNRFIGIGFLAEGYGPDPYNTFEMESHNNFCPTKNHCLGWWFENQILSQDGYLVVSRGNANIFDGFQYFDIGHEAGSSGHAIFLLDKVTGAPDFGGNEIRGMIPGREVTDRGVVVLQNHNSIVGVRSYNGSPSNTGGGILLMPGVGYTYVRMGGAISGVPGNSNVEDRSGIRQNTIFDAFDGTLILHRKITMNSLGRMSLELDGYMALNELAADPANNFADMGYVYTKDIAGISELFYMDDAGTVTQVTTNGVLNAAHTLDQAYDGLSGSGSGKTIIADSGPVEIDATGDMALDLDGYISLQGISDPSVILGKGYVYSKLDGEITGIELFYMDDESNVTQITKDGYLRLGPGYLPEVSSPVQRDDVGFIYTKDDAGDTELFYMDDAGNEVQLTANGNINSTLDSAYDGDSGAGSGKVITADSGAVEINTGDPNTAALVLDGYLSSSTNGSAEILGTEADGGASIGVKLGSDQTYEASGSKLLSVQNNTIERANVDYKGEITLHKGDNGQQLAWKYETENLTIVADGYTDSTIQIPKDAQVHYVTVRVTATIPTATYFDVGVAGDTTLFADTLSPNVGVTSPGAQAGVVYFDANTSIRITPDATPATATGSVRITIHYTKVTPPTS